MFKAIRQRFHDTLTIKALCEGAEKHANRQGQRKPGTEHFVLAALDLPDSTAAAAFASLGITAAAFRASIDNQYRTALANVGISADSLSEFDADSIAVPTSKGPYRTQGSVQNMMQVLTRDIMKNEQQRNSGAPLLGAHVLLAASAAQQGVCARAFQHLGIESSRLREAAKLAIERFTGAVAAI